MDAINQTVADVIVRQMPVTTPASLPEAGKHAGADRGQDTAAISQTGLQAGSAPRQPTQEELRENALTSDQMEEMFGDLSTALGGLLNNGNYMSGVSESGVRVSVERHTEAGESGPMQSGALDTSNVLGYSASIATSSGNLNLSFADSVFVQETEDGRTSVYFKESDTTRYYAADGSYTEEAGNLLRSDADSIIINVSGDVQVSGGNNLIFNWADDVSISTGSGNDSIVLAEKANNVTISTGGGNDSVSGGEVANSRIDLGSGDNELHLLRAKDSSISVSDGNTTISHNSLLVTKSAFDSAAGGGLFAPMPTGQAKFNFFELDNSSLSLGKGAHNVTLGSVFNGSTVSLESYRGEDNYGNAANIRMDALADSSFSGIGYGYNLSIGTLENSLVDMSGRGAGVNLLLQYVKDSKVNIDAQMASVRADTITGDSALTTAEGAYGLIFGEISGNAAISIAGGHTSLNVGTLTGNAHFAVGGGVSFNGKFGDISGSAVLTVGDHYAASLGIGSLSGNAVVQLGHGDKTVLVGLMEDSAMLDVGTGSSLVGIGSLSDEATLVGSAVVAENQTGRELDNVVDLGALSSGEQQAAKEHFWESLNASHRVIPSLEEGILANFKPGPSAQK